MYFGRMCFLFLVERIQNRFEREKEIVVNNRCVFYEVCYVVLKYMSNYNMLINEMCNKLLLLYVVQLFKRYYVCLVLVLIGNDFLLVLLSLF